MDKVQTRNDLTAAVPKFCLSLEAHRRTADGRVRTTQEFLTHFFPHDSSASSDRLFRFMPNDVRGPILAAWGIRGAKASLRDDDTKVQSVVYDALLAGDIDHTVFEDGLSAETIVRWVPLSDWWTFWRGGKLSKVALQKALASAYELALFDAKWFMDTLESRGGKLRGTDVLSDGLSKDDLTEWVRKIHESGDGSPKGLLAAIGWEKVVAKTSNEVLIAVIDAMVTKAGLVKPESKPAEKPAAGVAGAATAPASLAPAPAAGATAAPPAGPTGQSVTSPPPPIPANAKDKGTDEEWNALEQLGPSVENETTVSQKGDVLSARSAGLDSDDGMIVVVDDGEVDLSSTDAGSIMPGGSAANNDPPTSPRMLAADPVTHEEETAKPGPKPGQPSQKPPPPPGRPGRENRPR